jgi:hypothetical protein
MAGSEIDIIFKGFVALGSSSHSNEIGFDNVNSKIAAADPKEREYMMHLRIADCISH